MATLVHGFWHRETGTICYTNNTLDETWCGNQEQCYDAGMVLPFVNESTWDWRLRAILYLLGLLYRWVWLKYCFQSCLPSPKLYQSSETILNRKCTDRTGK